MFKNVYDGCVVFEIGILLDVALANYFHTILSLFPIIPTVFFMESFTVSQSFNPFKARWLLYILPRLTLKKFTFCSHSVRVFICLVWISEQRLSLYTALTD